MGKAEHEFQNTTASINKKNKKDLIYCNTQRLLSNVEKNGIYFLRKILPFLLISIKFNFDISCATLFKYIVASLLFVLPYFLFVL